MYNPKSMKVDLIHPPPYGEVPFKHLGLAYVAAGLRRSGFETRYHDVSERSHRGDLDFYNDLILRLSANAGDMSDLPRLALLGEVLFPDHGDSDLAGTIREQVSTAAEDLGDSQLVGMSYNTLTSYFAAALGRTLRSRGVKVILGGPLSRIDALTELLLRLGAADAILLGEGDHSAGPLFRAVAEGRGISEIEGVAWLANGAVERTDVGAAPHLDHLPWPELEGNILDSFLPISASRGCPRRCVYCSESGLWPKGYRRRDPARVVAEMEHRAIETGLGDFHFHDDLLNGSRSFMKELVVEARGRGFTWESFFEPYRLDRPLLEQMKEAGCRLVKYGIQSFSPRVLERMRRPTSLETIIETVVATYELGISTHYDMLIGHPHETEDDHQRNVEMIEELYSKTGDRLYFSLNPFYLAAGSALERDAEKHGIRKLYANPAELPRPLADALSLSAPYAEGYRSGIDQETVLRRMDELARILARHNKDYLFLGKESLPPAGPRGRRMLPTLEEASSHDHRPRRGKLEQSEGIEPPRLFTLNEGSNLRISPTLGALEPETGPEASSQELKRALLRTPSGSRILVAGGEPTLSSRLAPLLGLCRHFGRPVSIETNGLRCATEKYTTALRRHGLGHARVLLLATDAARADELGGVEGAHQLALRGARQLIASGVNVELGLLLSPSSVPEAPELAHIAEEHFPEVRRLVLVLTSLLDDGRAAAELSEVTAALRKAARDGGRVVFVEDRR